MRHQERNTSLLAGRVRELDGQIEKLLVELWASEVKLTPAHLTKPSRTNAKRAKLRKVYRDRAVLSRLVELNAGVGHES